LSMRWTRAELNFILCAVASVQTHNTSGKDVETYVDIHSRHVAV